VGNDSQHTRFSGTEEWSLSKTFEIVSLLITQAARASRIQVVCVDCGDNAAKFFDRARTFIAVEMCG
jgi:hypothetical protein